MLWYLAWLQETRNLYPGPRCRDGKMLMETRLSRNECQSDARTGVDVDDRIPLTNDHGDIFMRAIGFDDCESENYEALPPGPAPGVGPVSLAIPASPAERDPPSRNNFSQNFVDFNNNKFNNLYNQPSGPVQNNSPFTFFGVPIPSLNIGKMFGGSGRSTNNRANAGSRGKGRVQVFRPEDTSNTAVFKNPDRHEPPAAGKIPDDNQEKNPGASNDNNLFYRPYFQTPFQKPNIQKGGFTPVIPGSEGGFTPITDPSIRIIKQNISGPGRWPEEFSDRVPLVTETTRYLNKNKFEATIKPSHHAPYFVDGITHGDPIPTPPPPRKDRENTKESTNRSEITEKPNIYATSNTSKSTELEDDDDGEEDDEVEAIERDPAPPYQGVSKYEENDITTRLSIELGTATTVGPLHFNKPYTLHKNEPTMTRELTRTPASEFYDGVNHSPSSLSALVSSGSTQQSTAPASVPAAKRPPGKSTIEKVAAPLSSTVTPYTGGSNRGDEFSPGTHRGVSRYDASDFVTQNIVDLAQQDHPIGGNEIRKREDMDWYYATYNRTPIYDDFDEPGLNRYKSAAGRERIPLDAMVFGVLAVVVRILV